jgi:hypothetical protein
VPDHEHSAKTVYIGRNNLLLTHFTPPSPSLLLPASLSNHRAPSATAVAPARPPPPPPLGPAPSPPSWACASSAQASAPASPLPRASSAPVAAYWPSASASAPSAHAFALLACGAPAAAAVSWARASGSRRPLCFFPNRLCEIPVEQPPTTPPKPNCSSCSCSC